MNYVLAVVARLWVWNRQVSSTQGYMKLTPTPAPPSDGTEAIGMLRIATYVNWMVLASGASTCWLVGYLAHLSQ